MSIKAGTLMFVKRRSNPHAHCEARRPEKNKQNAGVARVLPGYCLKRRKDADAERKHRKDADAELKATRNPCSYPSIHSVTTLLGTP